MMNKFFYYFLRSSFFHFLFLFFAFGDVFGATVVQKGEEVQGEINFSALYQSAQHEFVLLKNIVAGFFEEQGMVHGENVDDTFEKKVLTHFNHNNFFVKKKLVSQEDFQEIREGIIANKENIKHALTTIRAAKIHELVDRSVGDHMFFSAVALDVIYTMQQPKYLSLVIEENRNIQREILSIYQEQGDHIALVHSEIKKIEVAMRHALRSFNKKNRGSRRYQRNLERCCLAFNKEKFAWITVLLSVFSDKKHLFPTLFMLERYKRKTLIAHMWSVVKKVKGQLNIFDIMNSLVLDFLFHRMSASSLWYYTYLLPGVVNETISQMMIAKKLHERDFSFASLHNLPHSQTYFEGNALYNPLLPLQSKKILKQKVSLGSLQEKRGILLSGVPLGGKTTLLRSMLLALFLSNSFGVAPAKKLLHTPIIAANIIQNMDMACKGGIVGESSGFIVEAELLDLYRKRPSAIALLLLDNFFSSTEDAVQNYFLEKITPLLQGNKTMFVISSYNDVLIQCFAKEPWLTTTKAYYGFFEVNEEGNRILPTFALGVSRDPYDTPENREKNFWPLTTPQAEKKKKLLQESMDSLVEGEVS